MYVWKYQVRSKIDAHVCERAHIVNNSIIVDVYFWDTNGLLPFITEAKNKTNTFKYTNSIDRWLKHWYRRCFFVIWQYRIFISHIIFLLLLISIEHIKITFWKQKSQLEKKRLVYRNVPHRTGSAFWIFRTFVLSATIIVYKQNSFFAFELVWLNWKKRYCDRSSD